MEKALLIKTLLVYISIWGLGLFLIWFRRRIEVFWKLIATIIFGLHVFFFWEEIQSGYTSLTANWLLYTLNFLKELMMLVFASLFYLWPFTLILIFYKADDIGSEKLLKFLCVLTLLLWLAYNIYSYFDKGIDKHLFDKLIKMI